MKPCTVLCPLAPAPTTRPLRPRKQQQPLLPHAAASRCFILCTAARRSVDYGLRLSCITFDNPVSLFSISLDFSRQMRTSRLLLALGAIQLLIMFTCIALPSIRSSVPKRASSLAARPVLPQPPPRRLLSGTLTWQHPRCTHRMKPS